MSEAVRHAPQREEIPAAYKWRLEDLFASDQEWEEAASELTQLFPQLGAFAGKLAYFNLMLLALYWLAVRLGLSPKLPFSFAMALFWLASQAGLLVYDRALQLFLVYYAARFQAR